MNDPIQQSSSLGDGLPTSDTQKATEIGAVSEIAKYHTVAKVGAIPEGEGRSFLVVGRMIGVFLKDGEYFAINDSCPHMGASLASGYVDGTEVICPWHAWRFCVKDGTWLDNPKSKIRSETFSVRVVGNDIQVCPTPLPANDCTHVTRN